ncbi:MAG: NAD(P)H-dependent oxidoreductase subunit E [Defluviitaleaceae bacterium]|nr:NAD(P)H-dependent oxidoreductase subunit E [Defluviitaleaceae bacterium]
MSATTDAAKYAELDAFIESLPSNDGALIPALHHAQGIFGHLPFEVQNHIAHKLRIPSSKVYGVVTFYSFFNINPKGRYKVQVCMGTACFVRGSGKVLDEFVKELNVQPGATSNDGMWSIDGLRCVGACGLAPVVTVNGKVYGRVEVKDVHGIIYESLAKGE